ncbi:MAG: TPM domain-containing protein [Lachnospiraceae bacterium]|nr:TPM domain-containing protein [Lachnospiraceae bacterium]
MMVQNRITKLLSLMLAAIISISILSVTSFAGTIYDDNSESGYTYFVYDTAELLSEVEEETVLKALEPISEFGHAGVIIIDDNPYNTAERYASEFLKDSFGTDKTGIVLIIDYTPGQHYLYICAGDKNFSGISASKCDIVTDNIYRYAKNEQFYTCALEGVHQINDVLNGINIPQPMKYLSNACLAIIMGLILAYFIASATSKTRNSSAGERLQNIYTQFKVNSPSATVTNTTKTYSPRSSGGGGGGHGGGGHGGGGGGGHHGGGHGF